MSVFRLTCMRCGREVKLSQGNRKIEYSGEMISISGYEGDIIIDCWGCENSLDEGLTIEEARIYHELQRKHKSDMA